MCTRRYLRAFLVGLLIVATSHVVEAGTFSASSRTEAKLIKCRVRAAQFLSHATFGAKPDEVEELAKRMQQIGVFAAKKEWIDQQLSASMTPTLHHPKAMQMIKDNGYTDLLSVTARTSYKDYVWWDTVISADDQLRQRMAWALAQIFAVDQRLFNSNSLDVTKNPRYLGIVHYYDTLVNNAVGNYRTTLEDVSLHPVMGVWLSHVRNRKENAAGTRFPDENFSREIQQLFTIGLYKQKINGVYVRDGDGNLIDTYTNEEIKAFARVFTGLRYDHPSNNGFYSPSNYHQPMVMFEGQHDTGEKVLHNGTVLPAGQTGMQDIQDGIQNLFDHPNCAPFVSRLLIQRLVKSNPTKGYIRRVATVFNNNGNGVRGDLAAVARAILLDREAQTAIRCKIARKPWRVVVSTRGTEHSRLQEPAVRYAALIRGFGGQSDYNANGTPYLIIPNLEYHLTQMAYRPHHVFNFYDKDHVPAELFGYAVSKAIPNGSIFAPELEIFTAVGANRIANRFRAAIIDGKETYRVYPFGIDGGVLANINFDLSVEEKLASDPAALMQHLDLMLACGTLSDSTRDTIAKIVTDETSTPYFEQRPELQATVRARSAIIATLTASACAMAE